MQTFLPYPDFELSARSLDRARLGKQRVEVLQLLKALASGGAWSNHPASKMWRGYTNSLVAYGVVVCVEWIERGYKDSCLEKILAYYDREREQPLPDWVGLPEFHAAHRSNLLRKAPEHYQKFGWVEADDLPYVWPV